MHSNGKGKEVLLIVTKASEFGINLTEIEFKEEMSFEPSLELLLFISYSIKIKRII